MNIICGNYFGKRVAYAGGFDYFIEGEGKLSGFKKAAKSAEGVDLSMYPNGAIVHDDGLIFEFINSHSGILHGKSRDFQMHLSIDSLVFHNFEPLGELTIPEEPTAEDVQSKLLGKQEADVKAEQDTKVKLAELEAAAKMEITQPEEVEDDTNWQDSVRSVQEALEKIVTTTPSMKTIAPMKVRLEEIKVLSFVEAQEIVSMCKRDFISALIAGYTLQDFPEVNDGLWKHPATKAVWYVCNKRMQEDPEDFLEVEHCYYLCKIVEERLDDGSWTNEGLFTNTDKNTKKSPRRKTSENSLPKLPVAEKETLTYHAETEKEVAERLSESTEAPALVETTLIEEVNAGPNLNEAISAEEPLSTAEADVERLSSMSEADSESNTANEIDTESFSRVEANAEATYEIDASSILSPEEREALTPAREEILPIEYFLTEDKEYTKAEIEKACYWYPHMFVPTYSAPPTEDKLLPVEEILKRYAFIEYNVYPVLETDTEDYPKGTLCYIHTDGSIRSVETPQSLKRLYPKEFTQALPSEEELDELIGVKPTPSIGVATASEVLRNLRESEGHEEPSTQTPSTSEVQSTPTYHEEHEEPVSTLHEEAEKPYPQHTQTRDGNTIDLVRKTRRVRGFDSFMTYESVFKVLRHFAPFEGNCRERYASLKFKTEEAAVFYHYKINLGKSEDEAMEAADTVDYRISSGDWDFSVINKPRKPQFGGIRMTDVPMDSLRTLAEEMGASEFLLEFFASRFEECEEIISQLQATIDRLTQNRKVDLKAELRKLSLALEEQHFTNKDLAEVKSETSQKLEQICAQHARLMEELKRNHKKEIDTMEEEYSKRLFDLEESRTEELRSYKDATNKLLGETVTKMDKDLQRLEKDKANEISLMQAEFDKKVARLEETTSAQVAEYADRIDELQDRINQQVYTIQDLETTLRNQITQNRVNIEEARNDERQKVMEEHAQRVSQLQKTFSSDTESQQAYYDSKIKEAEAYYQSQYEKRVEEENEKFSARRAELDKEYEEKRIQLQADAAEARNSASNMVAKMNAQLEEINSQIASGEWISRKEHEASIAAVGEEYSGVDKLIRDKEQENLALTRQLMDTNIAQYIEVVRLLNKGSTGQAISLASQFTL